MHMRTCEVAAQQKLGAAMTSGTLDSREGGQRAGQIAQARLLESVGQRREPVVVMGRHRQSTLILPFHCPESCLVRACSPGGG